MPETIDQNGIFPVTRVSVLGNLGSASLDIRRAAFDILTKAYWRPLCSYAKIRWSRNAADAEELTQGFLALAWEKEYFKSFDPERSRFRTFLRVCFDRFILVKRRQESSLRSGGGKELLPLDAVLGFPAASLADSSSAERLDELFDREFTRELFQRATERLKAEFRSRNRAVVFEVFARRDLALPEESAPGYSELASEFGVSVAQITNFLHAARRRFRELVLAELRELSHSHSEFRQEAWSILGVKID